MPKKPKSPPPVTGPCEVCDGTMKHTRTIPAAGIMREMHNFVCTVCGCPRTEEERGAAAEGEGARKFAA